MSGAHTHSGNSYPIWFGLPYKRKSRIRIFFSELHPQGTVLEGAIGAGVVVRGGQLMHIHTHGGLDVAGHSHRSPCRARLREPLAHASIHIATHLGILAGALVIPLIGPWT